MKQGVIGMGMHVPSLEALNSAVPQRHPLWMLVGAIVGLGASVGSLLLASWFAPGVTAHIFSFLPIFTSCLGALMFRKRESLVPLPWTLVGFPLLVASALYLGGFIRVFSPPGGSKAVLYITLTIVFGSLAYSHYAKKRPLDRDRIRRSLVSTCLMVAGVVVVCASLTIAAYLAPIPALKTALPTIVATSFAAWLSMSLLAMAWVASIRVWPHTTTHSAAAYS